MVSLPLRWACALGEGAGALAYRLLRGQRRRALTHLELAYGDGLDAPGRESIAQAVFRHAGRSFAELAFLSVGRGGNLVARARVQGLENLLGPLEEGRGVILLTAHYGNWELMSAVLPPFLPCDTAVVARELSNPGLDRLATDLRRRYNRKVFARGQTGRDYVRFLRKGGVLGVLGDIDTSRGEGMFVDFFGHPAWTQVGIGRLAKLSGARVVPAFAARDPLDPTLHWIEIEPPLAEPETADTTEWVEALTRSATQAIERAVRRRPEMWMWMHRRWRHRPGQRMRSRKM